MHWWEENFHFPALPLLEFVTWIMSYLWSELPDSCTVSLWVTDVLDTVQVPSALAARGVLDGWSLWARHTFFHLPLCAYRSLPTGAISGENVGNTASLNAAELLVIDEAIYFMPLKKKTTTKKHYFSLHWNLKLLFFKIFRKTLFNTYISGDTLNKPLWGCNMVLHSEGQKNDRMLWPINSSCF